MSCIISTSIDIPLTYWCVLIISDLSTLVYHQVTIIIVILLPLSFTDCSHYTYFAKKLYLNRHSHNYLQTLIVYIPAEAEHNYMPLGSRGWKEPQNRSSISASLFHTAICPSISHSYMFSLPLSNNSSSIASRTIPDKYS